MRIIFGILIPLISIVVLLRIRAGQRRERELIVDDEMAAAERKKSEDRSQ